MEQIANAMINVQSKPNMMFKMTDAARAYNHERLTEHDFNLSRLIQANTGITLAYGSKFRPMEQLEPLLSRHPNFPLIKEFIVGRMPYIFTRELDGDTMQLELDAARERGNHKSASKESDRLLELISKDVKHRFVLPVSTSTVRELKNAAAQPSLGLLVHQWMLNPDGSRVEKSSMTQDLYFSSPEPKNANRRIDMSAYPEMVYGWCQLRSFHFIAAL
jgi:hypothetical protein